MKFAYIDFEYVPKISRNNLVCAVIEMDGVREDFWLPDNKNLLVARIREIDFDGGVFVAFNAVSEAECFIDLGLNPLDFKWLCLRVAGIPFVHSSSDFAIWALEKNKSNKKQFEGESKKSEVRRKVKSSSNLVSFLEYFCGIKRDWDEKRDMIQKILDGSGDPAEILEYCYEDVKNLKFLARAIMSRVAEITGEPQGILLGSWIAQSKFCACTAIYGRNGIPLHMEILNKIVTSLDNLVAPLYLAANEHWKFYLLQFKNNRDRTAAVNGKWVFKADAFLQFVKHKGLLDEWPRTPTGGLKRDVETLQLYRKDPAFETLYGVSRTLSALKTFSKTRAVGEKRIHDYIDTSTGRQYPYFGIFGTLTSRNAASATSFIFAQASWLRCLVQPPPGHSIVSLDFSSQEVWIAACYFQDEKLLESVISGDVYMSFAIRSGMAPEGATKETHPRERARCKPVILGKLYGIGVNKMACDMGCSAAEARRLARSFDDTYVRFSRGRQIFIREHEMNRWSALPDGYLLMDNCAAVETDRYREGDHFRLTTGNFPIQGTGAVIMRLAVEEGLRQGVKILAPLHDEILFECRTEEVKKYTEIMKSIMYSCCKKVFPQYPACKIGVSVVHHGELYVDEKSPAMLRVLGKSLGIVERSKDEFTYLPNGFDNVE